MKGAEAEVSLAASQVYSITPSAFGVLYLEVLAEYGGGRFSSSIGFIVKLLYLS